MTSSSNFTGSNAFSSQSSPPDRAGHSDDFQKGFLASSVNLFKGDVQYDHPLVDLKGRNPDGSDTLKISISYTSNVSVNAMSWNLDAPTGVLGLGWSLPISAIQLQGTGGPSTCDRSYTISDNGISGTLVRQPLAPVLLSLPASLAHNWQDRQQISQELREGFTSNGLAVSADSILVADKDDTWRLIDSTLEQEYVLETNVDNLWVRHGGEFYQLQNYAFQHIIFYPDFNRWLLIDEQGGRRSFGGGVGQTEEGIATSRGNSIAWSIWWTEDGLPAWTGTGSAIDQTHQAKAWYLQSVTDRFGNQQCFAYNEFARDEETGLLPYVEQRIAQTGLAFTKAVYLTSATDVFGRRAEFSYEQKIWDAAGIQEYCDPHSSIPPLSSSGQFVPTGFQDPYEVLYLSSLKITGETGKQIVRYVFNYAPVKDQSAVDIAGKGGVYAKRLLTEFDKYDSGNNALPGLKLTYDLSSQTPKGQPGALLSISGASGGTSSYQYVEQHLAEENRTIDISTQNADESSLYYGPDYTAVVLYNSDTSALALKLLSWNGTWKLWSPPDDGVFARGNIDISTLNCVPAQDFVIVTFSDFEGSLYVYVWNKLAARPGEWEDASNLGLGAPFIYRNTDGRKIDFHAGADFFLVTNQSATDFLSEDGTLTRYSWDWFQDTWEVHELALTDTKGTWVACSDRYFATYANSNQELSLYWREADLHWCDAPQQIKILGANVATGWSEISLVSSTASVAFSQIIQSISNYQAVQLSLATWNSNHEMEAEDFGVIQDYFDDSMDSEISAVPTLISDSFMCLNSNAFRRTETGWETTKLITDSTYPNVSQKFISGQDTIGVLTINKSDHAHLTMQSWIPGQGWGQAQAVDITTLLTNDNAPSSTYYNLSFSGQDWLEVGSLLYYRGTSQDWNSVINDGPAIYMTDLLDQNQQNFAWLDSKSFFDGTPDFIALDTVTDTGTNAVATITLQNGPSSPQANQFPDRRLFTGTNSSGVRAAQPEFATIAAQTGPVTSMRLHRYQNNTTTGPITHYSVATATIDDAMGDQTSIAYEFVGSSATCASTGNDVSFHQSFMYPGTTTLDHKPFGSIETIYLNTSRIIDQADYFDLLEGQQVRKTTRTADGQVVESQEAFFEVTNEVLSDPISNSVIRLKGGWAHTIETISSSDCVESYTTLIYADPSRPYSLTGKPQKTSRVRTNVDGDSETFVSVDQDAIEIFPALWAQHALHTTAQTTQFFLPGSLEPVSSDQVVISAGASIWQAKPSAVGAQVMAPMKSASYDLMANGNSAFPFADPENAEAQGWQIARTISTFSPWGQPLDEVDPLGVPSALIYTANGSGTIAHVMDADTSACAATFFQSWEDLERFTIEGTFDSSCCYSGEQSVRLSPGQRVCASVTPSHGQPYVAGVRYRLVSGRGQLTFGGAELTLEATGSDWVYVTLPLEAETVETEAAFTAIEGDIWLDSLVIHPLSGNPSFQLADPTSLSPLLMMDAGGRMHRSLLDTRYQTVCLTNGADQLIEIRQQGYSRMASQSDEFDPANPNSRIKVSFADGGTIESFRDGGNWQDRWDITAGTWSAADGQLRGSSGSILTLTDQRFLTQQSGDTAAAFIEIAPSFDDDFSIIFDDISLSWTEDGLSSTRGDLIGQPRQCPSQWLLIRGADSILFYGDGQLILSVPGSRDSLGLSLVATNPLTLNRLSLGYNVRLESDFTDGAGRTLQVQKLWDDDSILTSQLNDPMNRAIALTKPIPGSFGSGAELPQMQYRPGVVDRTQFFADWETTAEMRGDAADYYSGLTWKGVLTSDDQGYPYAGIRYEASVRPEKIETSRPGRAHAMNQEIPADLRETNQYSSQSTWQDDPVDALEQPYHIKETRTEVGTLYQQAKGRLGQAMSTQISDPNGAVLTTSQVRRSYEGEETVSSTTSFTLPRGVGNESNPPEAGFIRDTCMDGKQRPISLTEPNSGTCQLIYDARGQKRFVLPALDPGEAYALYIKYDRVGRQVEEGILTGAWTIDALKSHAEDPTWPDAAALDYATLTGVGEYDGDGTDPLQIGKKVSAARSTLGVNQGGEAVNVTDAFTYDALGNILTSDRTICAKTTQAATLGYEYNALGQTTAILLPEGAPVQKIEYSYNDQGQTQTVTNADDETLFATYTYAADKSIAHRTVGGVNPWTIEYSYTSDQLPKAICANQTGASDHGLNQVYDYTPDGLIQSREIDLDGERTSDTFAYDSLRMLEEVSGTNTAAYGPYDLNGNIQRIVEGDQARDLAYTAGTDQIETIVESDGRSQALLWDARGSMREKADTEFVYDKVCGLTIQISNDMQTTAYAYTGSSERAWKATGDKETFYFSGAGTAPLLRKTTAGWDVLVHGAHDMVSWVTSQNRYNLLTDPKNSLLAASDDRTGQLESTYVYRAFGSLNQDLSQINVAVPYQFQGQEWDAEVSLYNFKARLYDPFVCQFHCMDTALQFPSPYVFLGNSPVNYVDPTGHVSVGAQVGIAAAGVAIGLAGLALTLVTAGVGSAVAAGAEASIVGTAEASALATDALVDGAATVGTEAATASAETGMIATAKETAKGIVKATAQAIVRRLPENAVAKRLTVYAGRAVAGGISGAVTQSGFNMAIDAIRTPNKDFSPKELAINAGFSAVAGFATGGVAAAYSQVFAAATEGLITSTARGRLASLAYIGSSTLIRVGVYDSSTILGNIVRGDSWHSGLGVSTVMSAGIGAVSGAFTSRFICKPTSLMNKISNTRPRVQTHSDEIIDAFNQQGEGETQPLLAHNSLPSNAESTIPRAVGGRSHSI